MIWIVSHRPITPHRSPLSLPESTGGSISSGFSLYLTHVLFDRNHHTTQKQQIEKKEREKKGNFINSKKKKKEGLFSLNTACSQRQIETM
jgi:hypothetical protein